jgi:two-component system LytT family response regulator
VHALDYLLKPISNPKLVRALGRVRQTMARGAEADRARVAALLDARGVPEGGETSPYPGRWAVRQGDRYVLLRTEEIDWVEAAANYLRFHARGAAFLMRGTLAALERALDPVRFARIHRSTIVNVDRVKEIRPEWHGDFDVTLEGGRVLRMSRTHRDRLLPRGGP